MTRKWKLGLMVFFTVVVLLVAAIAMLRMNTKKHSPVDKISIDKDNLKVEVVYCQPAKKGRLIFGEEADGALQPWGAYWRLGANEATTIEVASEVNFGGKLLEPGKYSLYAFPGKDTWQIGVNKGANRWGYSEPDYSKDVFKIEVPVTYSDKIVEMFTMALEPTDAGAELVMKWDTSVVRVPIE
jgi:hypothetical protein